MLPRRREWESRWVKKLRIPEQKAGVEMLFIVVPKEKENDVTGILGWVLIVTDLGVGTLV